MVAIFPVKRYSGVALLTTISTVLSGGLWLRFSLKLFGPCQPSEGRIMSFFAGAGGLQACSGGLSGYFWAGAAVFFLGVVDFS